MPIEYVLLKDAPCKIAVCPKCGATPFVPFLRGMVARRRYKWLFFGEWEYMALICSECKEIVGHESPWKLD